MKGQIYKNLSGKYLVRSNGAEYICTPRGGLKRKTDILIGDYVEFNENVIFSVMERKNRFIRPNVANVDAVAVLVSPTPKPDYLLLDKVIINARAKGTEIYIIVNKIDIDKRLVDDIQRNYAFTVDGVIEISALNKTGVSDLTKCLSGKLTCFCGQSAVGKTTLINAVFGHELKTGELSKKTERGRHTTTFSQIYEEKSLRIVDTPGFAVIEAGVKSIDLKDYYPEFIVPAQGCRFRLCTHVNEPDCQVRKLVADGAISEGRYERYREIYKQLVEKEDLYGKN